MCLRSKTSLSLLVAFYGPACFKILLRLIFTIFSNRIFQELKKELSGARAERTVKSMFGGRIRVSRKCTKTTMPGELGDENMFLWKTSVWRACCSARSKPKRSRRAKSSSRALRRSCDGESAAQGSMITLLSAGGATSPRRLVGCLAANGPCWCCIDFHPAVAPALLLVFPRPRLFSWIVYQLMNAHLARLCACCTPH